VTYVHIAGAAAKQTLKVESNFPLLIFIIALFAVTIGLSIVASGDNVLPGDVAVARFIQDAPQPPAQSVADFGNWIGSARVCGVVSLGVVALLLIARRPWDASIIVLALLARSLNGALKALIDSPRPTPDLVRVTEHARGLGFPSGHAMGSVLCYGAIALVAGHVLSDPLIKGAIQVACSALVLLVGFGRVYTGAHWPSDVAGGYLWGMALLTAVVFIVPFMRDAIRAERIGA
jgi:undecaprenyl-diphosphatase